MQEERNPCCGTIYRISPTIDLYAMVRGQMPWDLMENITMVMGVLSSFHPVSQVFMLGNRVV